MTTLHYSRKDIDNKCFKYHTASVVLEYFRERKNWSELSYVFLLICMTFGHSTILQSSFTGKSFMKNVTLSILQFESGPVLLSILELTFSLRVKSEVYAFPFIQVAIFHITKL